jgi:hypothetical protein
MVTTVSPKASDTPSQPMPLSPTEAARTAAPVPPKTSQKVPKNSATAAFPVFMCSTACDRVASSGSAYPAIAHSSLPAVGQRRRGAAGPAQQ